ncbi:hypothetical protein ACJ7VZ_05355 [Aeromonas salmonicida]|uniref:hypothetical protein n=1 Tax=Aeromonas salmonicida TaxID=645 RepID=UPI0038BAF7E2
MSVNISLTADTGKYVQRIKEARTVSDRELAKMEKDFDEFARGVNDNFTSVDGAMNSMMSSMRGVSGGGFVVGLGAIGAAAGAVVGGISMMAVETMKMQKEMERAAKLSGTSVEEFSKWSIAAQQSGIEMDKFADQMKDVMDRVGDYVTAGSGPMQDFFDVIKGKSTMTIDDLVGKSAPETLSLIAQEMDKVGASTAQVTFVLESLASDSTLLYDMLKHGQTGLDEFLSGYATKRAQLSSETMQDISQMDANFSVMANNFSTYLTEKFDNLYGQLAKLSKFASDMFADSVDEMQADNFQQQFRDRKIKVTVENYDEVKKQFDNLKVHDVRFSAPLKHDVTKADMDKMLADAESYKADIGRQIADVGIASRLKKENAGTGGISSGTGQSASDITKTAKSVDEANQMIEASNNRRAKLEEDIAKSRAAIADFESKGQSLAADEMKSRLVNQETNLKANIETHSNLESSRSSMMEREDTKREQAAQKASQKAIQLEKERAAAQLAVMADESSKLDVAHNQEIAKFQEMLDKKLITQQQYNAKIQQLETQHQQKLKDIENQKATERLQDERDVATTRIQEADADLALRQQHLQEKLEAGKITEDQYNNAVAEARREHNTVMLDQDNQYIQDDQVRNALQAEQKLAFLVEQHELGLISDQEFNAQRVQAEQEVTDAKRALLNVQLDQYDSLVSGISGLFEQGSAAQKKMFMMEKAGAIARLSLGMFDAWAAVDTNGLTKPGTPANFIAKAGVIAQYGGQIAAAGSIMLGQFHSGTDEVDSTGSYILKQGERVVQPTANKDLTSFLKNGGDGGGTTVNADLIIQGGGDGLNDSKFQEYLIKHREMVTQAVSLAKRENPSIR